MTNSIEEFENSDVVLLTGSNTTGMHPVISSFIKRGVVSGKTKLIVVDPRKIDLVDLAEVWLRQEPGTDIAWLNGMMNVIIREELYDRDYVQERTEDFDLLKDAVSSYTPEKVREITGIKEEDLIRAARLYAQAPAASIAYAMGITQHTNGTDTVKSIANLAMLCGNVGKESGGVNPLRGQNNVQGACDMGCLPNVLTAYQPVTDPKVREKFATAWGVDSIPDMPGLTVVEIINAAAAGKIKGLYIVGENPMVSDPDLHHVKESLDQLNFLVVQDIFLTETAELADVVLPAACFAEKEGTFSNTERRVQRVRKAVEPPAQARQDWEIICEISARMGYAMDYRNPEAIFAEMRKLTPSYAGITYERLDKGGLQWPCPSEDHPGTKFLHKDKFTRGKGKFFAVHYTPPVEQPDGEYPFLLMTGRVLFQYHTRSMTRRSQGLNECAPECLVEINRQDAANLGVESGDMVRLVSRRGAVTARIAVGEITGAGTVFMPFHYYEAAANKLTNATLDPVAKIPEYKVCSVRVEKAA